LIAKIILSRKKFNSLANAKEFHLRNMRRNNARINNDIAVLIKVSVDDFL